MRGAHITKSIDSDIEIKGPPEVTRLKLVTTYSIDKRFYFLLNLPVRLILKIFHNYLLSSIKKNSEL